MGRRQERNSWPFFSSLQTLKCGDFMWCFRRQLRCPSNQLCLVAKLWPAEKYCSLSFIPALLPLSPPSYFPGEYWHSRCCLRLLGKKQPTVKALHSILDYALCRPAPSISFLGSPHLHTRVLKLPSLILLKEF